MDYINANMNIHYSAPREVWDMLGRLYSEMPHWEGFADGIPHWYSRDDNTDGKLIWASVEPGGLQFYAQLSQAEWDRWIAIFKTKASQLLGYEIGEPEDGYEFHYFD